MAKESIYNRLKRGWMEWAVVGFVMALGLTLRWHDYGTFPVAGETKDEFAWSWLGESLLSGRKPTSWSWFPVYEDTKLVLLAGQEFRIASPVFDNPPLFSLIPGLMMKLRGIDGIQLPPITLIRFPMLLIGTLAVGLVYLAGKLWVNREVGLTAAVLMATVPTFVFASRMVLAENLLIIWLLLGLIFLAKYQSTTQRKWLYGMAIMAGLSILTKVTGVFVGLALGLYLIHLRNVRALFIFASTMTAIASLWLVYAIVFGIEQFLAVQFSQASLPIGFGSILNLFIRPYLADKPFFDGWFIAGLTSLFSLALISNQDRKSNSPLVLTLLLFSWLLVLVASAGEQTWHGWYRYPLFPVISLGLGYVIVNAKTIFWLLPMAVLGLLPSLRLGLLFTDTPFSSLSIRSVIVLLLLLSAYWLWTKPVKVPIKFTLALLVLITLINSIAILNLTQEAVSKDDVYFFPIRTGI